jgi:hypothetical protein
LKDELMNLGFYDDEGEAIESLALAFKNYFLDAASNGIPVSPVAADLGEVAMRGALTGLSTTGAAAIQAGIVAFWGALVPAVVFPPALAIIPPPTLAGIAAALTPVFLANTVGKLGKEPSMDAISVVLHANNLGGTAAFLGPPPLVSPIL